MKHDPKNLSSDAEPGPTLSARSFDSFLQNIKATASPVQTDSALKLKLIRLVRIHPELKRLFKETDLDSMNDAMLQSTLADVNQALGINPEPSLR